MGNIKLAGEGCRHCWFFNNDASFCGLFQKPVLAKNKSCLVTEVTYTERVSDLATVQCAACTATYQTSDINQKYCSQLCKNKTAKARFGGGLK